MKQFDRKDPAEIVTLTFDFTRDLVPGETLSGAPIVSCTTHSGTDASPGNVLNGAAQLAAGNKQVLQSVKAGALGAAYAIAATCATSTGRTLALGGVMDIEVAALM